MPIESLESKKYLSTHRPTLRKMQETLERGVAFTQAGGKNYGCDFQKIISDKKKTKFPEIKVLKTDIPIEYNKRLAPTLTELQLIHNSLYARANNNSFESLYDIFDETRNFAANTIIDDSPESQKRISPLLQKLEAAAEEFITNSKEATQELLDKVHKAIKKLVNRFRTANGQAALTAAEQTQSHPIKALERHLLDHRTSLREIQATLENGIAFTGHREDFRKIVHTDDEKELNTETEICEWNIPTLYDQDFVDLTNLQEIYGSLYAGSDVGDTNSLAALNHIFNMAFPAEDVQSGKNLLKAAEKFIADTQEQTEELLGSIHQVIKNLVNQFRKANEQEPLVS